MVKQTPFTALTNSGDLSFNPESLYGDNPRSNKLQLSKTGSLRNLEDTPVSCPHPAVSQEDIRKARFSLSLRDMAYDPNEDTAHSKPAPKSKRDSTGSRGLLSGKFKETMSKTVGMALKGSSPAKKSQKGNTSSSASEETTNNNSTATTATTNNKATGELKVVDNGTHLELQTPEQSDESNNTDNVMEDNSSKQVNARAPGRLRRTGSTRNISNRNSTASGDYSRQLSKSKNGRRGGKDDAAAAATNTAVPSTTRRSKSQDKAMERSARDRKLNRSKSERKFRGAAQETASQETTTTTTERRNRSKSRDRTVRRARSAKKLIDNKDNSNSDLSAAAAEDSNNKSKRAHSNSRSKQMQRARSNKKLMESSQSSELSLSKHELSASEPGRRTRSSSRTRRDKSKGRSSNNKKMNSSISDFSSMQQNGHSRSSRLALKRAASLMTTMQHKKNSNHTAESIPEKEHSSGSHKTANNEETNNKTSNAAPPARGIRRARSQSSVSARSEASARSLASMRSMRSEGERSQSSLGHSSHREATITAQPRRRISRPTLRKAMSQSTMWAAKNGAAEVSSAHSKDNVSYSSRGSSASNTVEAVAEPREDDETLEEAMAYPQSPAGTLSIDDSVATSPPDLVSMNDMDSIQADAMAMLKEKINVSALIPDLENGKSSPLETLMETARSAAGSTTMDEDSTIVSMNSVDKLSAIERAVQEAFEEALQAAVKQHTQSISTTAANHLMNRLRRDGAPVLD